MTNDDMGQSPLFQVLRLRPSHVSLREHSWELEAGPEGMLPRVVFLMTEECLPDPRLLTASMYTSYSVPHLIRYIDIVKVCLHAQEILNIRIKRMKFCWGQLEWKPLSESSDPYLQNLLVLLEVCDGFPPDIRFDLYHLPCVEHFPVKYLIWCDGTATVQMICPLHSQWIGSLSCHTGSGWWWGN